MIDFHQLAEQGFTIKEATIAGEECYLVVGDGFEIKWNPDNLIYRSSIWTKDGDPVSLGYRKFFNYGEKPNIVPDPVSLKDAVLPAKLDGSCLIISKFKDQLIVRTRGTFEISPPQFKNSEEIDFLKNKYPKVFDNEHLNSEEYSIICEWYSPNNVIVLNYGVEPDLWLTGIIHHLSYIYMSQKELDKWAEEWNVKRPEYYSFNDLPSMIQAIEALKGKEGVCVYYDKEQNIKKLKSLDYKAKHAFKSNMSLDSLVDVFIQLGYPNFNDFYTKIGETFDFECAQMAMPFCSKIADAWKEVTLIVDHMKAFCTLQAGKTRKDAALAIMEAYGKTSRSGFVFSLLDGKKMKDEQYKKLLFQILKGCA